MLDESAAPGIDLHDLAALARLRVELAHDWLLGMRGGEWVLDALLPLFPTAPISTLFYEPAGVGDAINRRAIRPSALNRLPAVIRYYRWLLPSFPWAARRMGSNSAADLLFITSHCAAHGFAMPGAARRIHYYFSPMRYLYDQGGAYAAGNAAGGGLAHHILQPIAPTLRRWDAAAARRGDEIWAISHFVAERIRRVYGLEARVIYPPVRTERFTPPRAGAGRIDEDLLVSALVPYKRVDLAIEAANRLKRPLRIVGGGPLLQPLRRMAGHTVTLEGPVGEGRLVELYQTRRMLIFPGEEDFGIVPLEAMACGMPVLAQRAGALTETLAEGVCGEFFERNEVDALAEAWRRFDAGKYAPAALRARAEKFSVAHFQSAIASNVLRVMRRDGSTRSESISAAP